MSTTRKILLVISILVGGLGLFKIYDLTSASSYRDSEERDAERSAAELRRLESGESVAGGEVLDASAREAQIELLRDRIKSQKEMRDWEADHDRGAWRNTILMLLVSAGLVGSVVMMGKKDGPKAFVRLGQVRPGVVVAAVTGLISAALLVSFANILVESQEELTSSEERLVDIKSKLETFEFDRAGNVAPGKEGEFASLITSAKYAPDAVVQARGNRNLAVLIVVGSMLGLALSSFFGRRSWKRSFPATIPARQPVAQPVAS